MYICEECREVFEEPENYFESHGLESGAYEHLSGCPHCLGYYKEV